MKSLRNLLISILLVLPSICWSQGSVMQPVNSGYQISGLSGTNGSGGSGNTVNVGAGLAASTNGSTVTITTNGSGGGIFANTNTVLTVLTNFTSGQLTASSTNLLVTVPAAGNYVVQCQIDVPQNVSGTIAALLQYTTIQPLSKNYTILAAIAPSGVNSLPTAVAGITCASNTGINLVVTLAGDGGSDIYKIYTTVYSQTSVTNSSGINGTGNGILSFNGVGTNTTIINGSFSGSGAAITNMPDKWIQKDFGATGGADDTMAFQAAAYYAGPVKFEPGTYTIQNIQFTNGTHWIGNSDVVIQFHTNATGIMLNGTETLSNIQIRGLIFDGQSFGFLGTGPSGSGLVNAFPWQFFFFNTNVTQEVSVNRTAIQMSSHSTNSFVTQNIFKNFSDAGTRFFSTTTFPQPQYSTTICTGNNYIRNWVGVDNTQNAEYMSISGNQFENNGVSIFKNAGNVQFNNNIVTRNGVGVAVMGGGSNPAHGEVIGNIINHNDIPIICSNFFQGELIENNDFQGGGPDASLIWLINCDGVSVNNNLLSSTTSTVIQGNGGQGGKNHFDYNAWSGGMGVFTTNTGALYTTNGNTAFSFTGPDYYGLTSAVRLYNQTNEAPAQTHSSTNALVTDATGAQIYVSSANLSTNGETLLKTNIVIGTPVTNIFGFPITVKGLTGIFTEAAVVGRSGISWTLTGANGQTNSINQITAIGIATGAMSNAIPALGMDVNAVLTFSDTSTGAGNSSALSGGQISYVQQLTTANTAAYNTLTVTNYARMGALSLTNVNLTGATLVSNVMASVTTATNQGNCDAIQYWTINMGGTSTANSEVAHIYFNDTTKPAPVSILYCPLGSSNSALIGPFRGWYFTNFTSAGYSVMNGANGVTANQIYVGSFIPIRQ